jgi:hypothetical protein
MLSKFSSFYDVQSMFIYREDYGFFLSISVLDLKLFLVTLPSPARVEVSHVLLRFKGNSQSITQFVFNVPSNSIATEIVLDGGGILNPGVLLASQAFQSPVLNHYTWKASGGTSIFMYLNATSTPPLTSGPLYLSFWEGSSFNYAITVWNPPLNKKN